MTSLLLASASPARLATLRAAGLDPAVLVSGVDEPAVVERYGVTDAEDVCLVLAKAKAEDVAANEDRPEDHLVLGCDSVLAVDLGEGVEVLGKPADAADAVRRWKAMRGRSGVLHTGHWLIDDREDGSGATIGGVASVTVHFADVTDEEIDAYVATGEPLQVAGAFTVDGLGGAFVRGIEGDHHAVVGVSLPLLRDLVREAGVAWPDLWATREA
ncbi:nucleoside triphosphate pyrophosphatase [Kineococcus endophyticus]|uniref:Nucleoside triphosphate pyrophosphatase n=1 Tax=Kineococcus endophyticus TaxID=1181883 RepID=A0ABV3P848_9ACTN